MQRRTDSFTTTCVAGLLAVLAACLPGGCSLMKLDTASEDTTIYSLDNGLTVVIREDHFAPVVAEQIWVRAGAADEADIEAGVAHVHEHMLFKGTERRGVGEIAAEIESSGGRINAWTSWDSTVYHIVVASRHAGEGLDILADAVRHSSFDAGELDKELGVVMEEWKRSQDSPGGRLFKGLFAAAFDEHTYRRPVIGTEESITGLTREMILDFYGRYYRPGNMTVVIVGDVDAAEVKKDVERLFGDFAARPAERPARAIESPQEGLRRATESMEIKEAHIALGFHIPDANHPDAVVLDVLAHVLGSGESSRLYRRLIAESQIATSSSAFAYTPPDPGLFVFTTSFEAEDEAEVLAAMLEEAARVRDEAASEEELERARANLESSFVYRRQTVQGQARELGSFVVVHDDPNYDETYTRALRAVSARDVQRAARQYLTRDNLTVLSVLPSTFTSEIDEEAALKAASVLDETAGAPLTESVSFKPPAGVPATAKKAVAQGESGEPKLVRLDNGVRIIVQEHHEVPVFSMRAAVLAGLLAENAENNGISNFVADVLTRGTRNRSHEELAAAIESLAGDVGGFSGRNSLGVAAGFLSENFDEGMDLALEVLLEPAFNEEDTEKARRELLLAIKNREDEASHRAFNLIYKTVYPDHPYGMTTLGETESVEAITTADLRAFYENALDPSNLVVGVVGDVDADAVVAKLTAALGGLKDDATRFEMPPSASAPDTVRQARLETERYQSHIVLGYPGVDVKDDDRHALAMLETVLARQGGRLFYELRDQQALAYSVTAFSSEGLAPGLVGGYIATDPDNEERAIEGLLVEFEKVRNAEIEAQELERAQRYLIGSHEIGMQTNGAITESMVFDELYGLGYLENRLFAEQMNSVTIADVQRVARKYLTPSIRSEVVVGPSEDARAAAN